MCVICNVMACETVKNWFKLWNGVIWCGGFYWRDVMAHIECAWWHVEEVWYVVGQMNWSGGWPWRNAMALSEDVWWLIEEMQYFVMDHWRDVELEMNRSGGWPWRDVMVQIEEMWWFKLKRCDGSNWRCVMAHRRYVIFWDSSFKRCSDSQWTV
jgi:hypothetical protein